MKIFDNSTLTEVPHREGNEIAEMMNTAEVPDISVALSRVPPGVTTELHALRDVRELYIIESGTGQMNDGGPNWQDVGPRDVVHIAANAPQRVRNTGTDDLVFLCICTGRYVPDCYQPLRN